MKDKKQKQVTLKENVYDKLRAVKFRYSHVFEPVTWDAFMRLTITMFENILKAEEARQVTSKVTGEHND